MENKLLCTPKSNVDGKTHNSDNIKNMLLLSIAIPTFNGSKYIREALDSIVSQSDALDEDLEVVISDNASTDDTPEIIMEFQSKYQL
jgi:glycosyltransferase involved in cell wall biosynthesis